MAALASPAAALAQPAALTPLSAEVRQALVAVRSDPPPKSLILDRHYSTSNELRQYLYRHKIKPAGGLYIGVGSEQNYVLGGWARNPLTGEVSRDATLDGLFTYVTGGGVATTVNSEFAAVWAGAPAVEKAAAAEAVRLALDARKGMIVEGITVTGEAARGILREVYRATPAGAGLAAVEVLLDSNGRQIPATVTEPFRTLPSASGGGTGE